VLFSSHFGRKLENYRRIHDLIASRLPDCPLLGAYKRNLDSLDRVYTARGGRAA
jgi:hypothetical protein